MSLSFCPFFYVLVRLYVLSQLYPQSYLIFICSFLVHIFMSFIFGIRLRRYGGTLEFNAAMKIQHFFYIRSTVLYINDQR